MSPFAESRQVWVRSGVLAGAAPLLTELGVDAAALAADCGLNPEAFDQADLPVPGPAVVGFFESAAERSGCEDFGLLNKRRCSQHFRSLCHQRSCHAS